MTKRRPTTATRPDGQKPLVSSPSQTVGPFFHDALIAPGGNCLVEEGTRGSRIRIAGQVLDGDGEPVEDAMVEIWQPDATGVFPHPTDPRRGEADPCFRGFGRADTAKEGRFSFETIRPGAVRGAEGGVQGPYINIRIFARGLLHHLVTRAYLPDESNDGDPVLSSVPSDRRSTLIARREPPSGTDDVPTFRFDIRLQGPGETVFFEL